MNIFHLNKLVKSKDLKDKYSSSGWGRIGNALSQLGHSLAWGASDVSISGKTGYKYIHADSKLWKLNRKIVDFAFRPIDGKEHCVRAYLVDNKEKYKTGEGIYQNIICSLFIWAFCPIISGIAYPIKWIKSLANGR